MGTDWHNSSALSGVVGKNAQKEQQSWSPTHLGTAKFNAQKSTPNSFVVLWSEPDETDFDEYLVELTDRKGITFKKVFPKNTTGL